MIVVTDHIANLIPVLRCGDARC